MPEVKVLSEQKSSSQCKALWGRTLLTICLYVANYLANRAWCYHSAITVCSGDGGIWVMHCAQFLLNIALCIGLQLLFSQIQESRAFSLSLVFPYSTLLSCAFFQSKFYKFHTDIWFFWQALSLPRKCIFLMLAATQLHYTTWGLSALLKETRKAVSLSLSLPTRSLLLHKFKAPNPQMRACFLNCTKLHFTRFILQKPQCKIRKVSDHTSDDPESDILFSDHLLNHTVQPKHSKHIYSPST